MKPAITRFAPSPTGYIHIGNVRSAIYPYLIAKQTDGKFLLRIEDTDQNRYVAGATDLVIETLRWLGLDWDEEPCFQTSRKELYLAAAKQLIAEGKAYADPTDSETIEEYRQADTAQKIPYLYRNHRPTQTPEWHEGLPIRFKADPKPRTWHDEVMGDLHAGPEVQDDIILIKKDGLPTYNFAHIIDDHAMGITHVMRGVEYVSSTPNYLALYEALGFEQPKLVSLPHILAPSGNKKLGKRDGAKSVTEYKNDGILPETMLNYLACLGWNDGTEQEIYTKDQLISAFSIDRIQSSGARYDETKLLWLNGQWIRKIKDEQGIDALFAKTAGFWPESAKDYPETYQKAVLNIVYDRLKKLSELPSMTNYFFEDPKISPDLLLNNKFLQKLSETELKNLLTTSIAKLGAIDDADWTTDHLQSVLNALLAETGKKPAELFSLLRIAVSFAPFSPALNLTFHVLGKKVTLSRLNATSNALTNDL